jgi:GldM C-terminal domain
MIKAIISVCFLLSYLENLSQEIIISNPRRNKFYIDMDNPLNAMVEGYPCRSVILSTDNGSIEKTSCYYSFHPARTGEAKIQVKIKKGNTTKKLKEITLYIDPFLPPRAYVGGLEGGQISKGAFSVQGGVGAGPEPNLGFELSLEVTYFTIIIIRNDSVLFCRKNNSYLFDTATKEILKSLQNDDTVLITKIMCRMADDSLKAAKPLEFYIK